jgi:hypothetical protein
MHITIRRYKTEAPKEVTRRVNEGFFPLLVRSLGLSPTMASKPAKMVGFRSVCLKQPQGRRNPTALQQNLLRTIRT